MHNEHCAFDLIVAGAGIVGLAHAWMGARRGLRVAVVERDHRCVGASIRNFGFVTVTGQRAGSTWRRAMRSRDLWAELAPQAGIPLLHRGLWVRAERPEAMALLEAFAATEMGAACTLHDGADFAARAPALRSGGIAGALHSPHELRVESRTALPALAAWLQAVHGVRLFFGESVLEAEAPRVRTSRRTLHAERVVLCPGTELNGVAADALAGYPLRLTRLQMLRVQPEPGFALPGAVMGDLSLVRYAGYAELPQAPALAARLQQEHGDSLAHGIHLVVVQSADGSLVVGDSHHDDASPEPYVSEAVDRLILSHLRQALNLERCEVLQRWIGVYPVGHTQDHLVHHVDAATRIVLVTSGTGASTAFGLAEEVLAGW